MPQDDRTAKARIRDVAIALVAAEGTDALTARRVAQAADVSPGLVTHHYGSMDGLQEACDRHIATLVRDAKQDAMAQGVGLDPLTPLRASDMPSLLPYLARRLWQDTPAVARLVDEMVDDAETYLGQGEESGIIRPADDARGRAVVLVLWSLGGLVLHQHLRRLLGVDLTDPDLEASVASAAYARPAFEVIGRGVLTEAFAAQILDRLPPRGEARPEPSGKAPT